MITFFSTAAGRLLPALMCLIALQACHPYRINIQQGNYLDEDTIGQVETGMTRAQVKFLLGTPLVADAFNEDRWDYIFHYRDGKSQRVVSSNFVVFFDGNVVDYTQRLDDSS